MTTESKIDEKIKKTTQEPSVYNVIFLNDDVTPMDWVTALLKQLFRHSESSASHLTMKIHNEGSAVVGTYQFQIAEQKSTEAVAASRQHGFPLKVKIEET